MIDGGQVVFVEVRYRASDRCGDGLASITPTKRRRLINAARSWLKRHPTQAGSACRFDAVSVTGAAPDAELRWVRGAFETT
jgi:putative endonuclease